MVQGHHVPCLPGRGYRHAGGDPRCLDGAEHRPAGTTRRVPWLACRCAHNVLGDSLVGVLGIARLCRQLCSMAVPIDDAGPRPQNRLAAGVQGLGFRSHRSAAHASPSRRLPRARSENRASRSSDELYSFMQHS